MKRLTDRSPVMIDDPRFHREPLLGEWSVIEVANAAKALWGELAVTAIAWGALSANCDGNMPEYRFWFQVFNCLREDSSESELEGMMVPDFSIN